MGIWHIIGIIDTIPYQEFFLLILVGTIAVLKAGVLGKNYERIDHLEKPVCIFAGASILLYIIFSWIYPFLDVYIDHVEPAVVITSILLLRGQEVYPDWTQGGAIYGMIYGPLLYFIHAAFLYASPTIAFSKLAAVIAIWMAIAILAFEFFRLTKSYIVTLLSIACVIVIFSFFGNFTFWNRPEPFLILLSAAALPTLRLKKDTAALTIGLLSGIAVAIKAHASLYFAPLVLAFMASDRSRPRVALRFAAIIIVVNLLVSALPFLHTSVDFLPYVNYLKLTADQGYVRHLFMKNASLSVVLLSPIPIFYLFRAHKTSSFIKFFFLFFCVFLFFVVCLASKLGAGPHHLLPFVPFAFYFVLKAMTESLPEMNGNRPIRRFAISVFVLLFIGLSPKTFSESAGLYSRYARSISQEAQINELEAIFAKYPLAEMGVTDGDSYKSTYNRVVGVLQGSPVHLDLPFLLDLVKVEEGATESEEIIRTCRMSEVILPERGQPFSMDSFYKFDGQSRPVFSDTFRSLFQERYSLVYEGEHYNVWTCSGNTDAPPAKS